MKLPLAVEEIHKDGFSSDINEEVWNSLKLQTVETSNVWVQKFEEKCASLVVKSRRNAGTNAVNTASDVPNTENIQQLDCESVCQLATSFFIRPDSSSFSEKLLPFNSVVSEVRGDFNELTYKYPRD